MENFFEFVPLYLSKVLHKLSINEALTKGIIDDIGDVKGNFSIENANWPGNHYAIVQGYVVKCSHRLNQEH